PTLSETVQAWRDYLPRFLPLPHPSPRNQAWWKRRPWFEAELVPELRRRVKALLD
ncbi:MAG TPA: uracil-DNA glycosylase family protein, partial [Noviherbaspirillum sp.]|nr:uracil-DNA glycosylase family protein [Noviherbaspirillum sp.]